MPFDAPFQLGPFTIDPSGSLMPPIDSDASFSVRWRGCLVRAVMRPIHGVPRDGRVELELQAMLGRVPSSAEAAAGAREGVLAMMRALGAGVRSGITASLSADHRVMLEESRRVGPGLTISVLLIELTGFVLDVAPYLDLAAEYGVIRP